MPLRCCLGCFPRPCQALEAVVCLACFGWGGTSRLTKFVWWMVVICGIANTALIYTSQGWPWAVLNAVLAAMVLLVFSHSVELARQKAESRKQVGKYTQAAGALLIGPYQACLPLTCHGQQCLGPSIIILLDICDATACLASCAVRPALPRSAGTVV